jgi:hypothetical protein
VVADADAVSVAERDAVCALCALCASILSSMSAVANASTNWKSRKSPSTGPRHSGSAVRKGLAGLCELSRGRSLHARGLYRVRINLCHSHLRARSTDTPAERSPARYGSRRRYGPAACGCWTRLARGSGDGNRSHAAPINASVATGRLRLISSMASTAGTPSSAPFSAITAIVTCLGGKWCTPE